MTGDSELLERLVRENEQMRGEIEGLTEAIKFLCMALDSEESIDSFRLMGAIGLATRLIEYDALASEKEIAINKLNEIIRPLEVVAEVPNRSALDIAVLLAAKFEQLEPGLRPALREWISYAHPDELADEIQNDLKALLARVRKERDS